MKNKTIIIKVNTKITKLHFLQNNEESCIFKCVGPSLDKSSNS